MELKSTLKVNQSFAFLSQGPALGPLGMGLPRPVWVRLNRLRTGVGRLYKLYKLYIHVQMGICSYIIVAFDQTAVRVILE